jgi:hypothetical protein
MSNTIITPTTQRPIASFMYAPAFSVQALLEHSARLGCQVLRHGIIAEFGVAGGVSTRIIRNAEKDADMHAFDSFDGLPSNWTMGPDRTWNRGAFSTDGKIPNIEGVHFHKGMFSNTIPEFLLTESRSLAYLSIDCDLYNSAKDVLWLLDSRIVCDTVIYFDEICDWGNAGADRYPNWPEGEFKAFVEWLVECNRAVNVIGRNDRYGAAVRVIC